jgi:hypothetical protein
MGLSGTDGDESALLLPLSHVEITSGGETNFTSGGEHPANFFVFICPTQECPFKLRQRVVAGGVSSVVHVPGRADRHIITTTACNKPIGLILRVIHQLIRDLASEPSNGKDLGYVPLPKFN